MMRILINVIVVVVLSAVMFTMGHACGSRVADTPQPVAAHVVEC